MLWVSEHGRIRRGETNTSLPDGNLQLCPSDFDSVLSLLDESARDSPGLEPILRYTRPYGHDTLVIQQYAGVIRTESGCQIEILPKISKRVDVHAARKLLVKMLIEISDSPFKAGTLAALEAHNMPLFELLMRQFLEHVGSIVRKGIARTYVSRSDNLIFLRGKLELSEHLRANAFDRSRLYCRFDEFHADRPINRLIRGALEIVNRLTEDSTNEQRCREFLYWFDGVPATQDSEADFRAVQMDRLLRHYEPAMPTCRLILEGLNPLTQRGDRKAVSMLFPMNVVFESYVLSKLGKQLPGWRVTPQVHGRSLVESHLGKTMFALIPDIQLSRGNERVIADTKWKLVDESDRQDNYGISQSDVYQLFAYSRKYLAEQVQQRVVLIYPRTTSFQKPLRPFWYRQDHEVLYVLPYDLDDDRLIVDEDLFLPNDAKSALPSN